MPDLMPDFILLISAANYGTLFNSNELCSQASQAIVVQQCPLEHAHIMQARAV